MRPMRMGNRDPDPTKLSLLPDACVLLPILRILHQLEQLQRHVTDGLVPGRIVQRPETLDDVVADQGAALFRRAFAEPEVQAADWSLSR